MIKTKLTPDREARYRHQLETATSAQKHLARVLQRIAFPDKPEYASLSAFDPAPLYLDMAFTLSERPELFIVLGMAMHDVSWDKAYGKPR